MGWLLAALWVIWRTRLFKWFTAWWDIQRTVHFGMADSRMVGQGTLSWVTAWKEVHRTMHLEMADSVVGHS